MALTCPTCEKSGTECTCNRGYLILRNGQVVEFQPDLAKAQKYMQEMIDRDLTVLVVIEWFPFEEKVDDMNTNVYKGNMTRAITYRIVEA